MKSRFVIDLFLYSLFSRVHYYYLVFLFSTCQLSLFFSQHSQFKILLARILGGTNLRSCRSPVVCDAHLFVELHYIISDLKNKFTQMYTHKLTCFVQIKLKVLNSMFHKKRGSEQFVKLLKIPSQVRIMPRGSTFNLRRLWVLMTSCLTSLSQ